MEDKKKYIAVILFLLIGLTIFAFANPAEDKDLQNEIENGNSQTETIKEETDDTSNSSTDNDDTITNKTISVTKTNNGKTSNSDNGYAKALAAVETAESSLKTADVSTAYDLVSKVTNKNLKTGLYERINVVEGSIKAIELVDSLEKQVNESTSLNEINSARDYRTAEKIATIVSALKNTTVKETLTDRLNTLAKVLDDNIQPVITGIKNNEITKEDVTLLVEDDNNVTVNVTLNDSKIIYQNPFDKEGIYTVTAVDAAYNSQTITFTIDKTSPTGTVTTSNKNGSQPTNQDVTATLTASEAINTPKGWTKVSDTEYTKKYTKNTTEEVEIEDLAGNKSTVKVEITNIDKTAPTATLSMRTTKPTNKNLIVTLNASEAINTPKGWTKVSDTEYTKKYTKNTTEEVEIEDLAGNKSTVKVEITNIDKTAPIGTVTTSNKNGSQPTNQDVTATLNVNEAINTPNGWTEVDNSNGTEFTKTYSENGKYQVSIVDKAGNEAIVKFEVKRIDKDAPILTVISPNKYQLEVGNDYTDKGYSAYDAVDKDVTNLIKITYQFQAKGSSTWPFVNKLDTSKLGTYKVIYTAYDKAGNMAKGTRVVQIVDTTSPLLTLNGEKDITLEAGVDTYEEKYATAVDNYDGLIKNIQPNFINYRDLNNNLSKVTTVDTTKAGTYKIVYKYTDSSDNEAVDANRDDHNYVMRTVVINDTRAPKLKLNGEANIILESTTDEYIELGAVAVDEADGTINLTPSSINYSVDGVFKGTVDSVDMTKPGTYKITYKYEDKAGNIGVDESRSDHNYVMRTVIVKTN